MNEVGPGILFQLAAAALSASLAAAEPLVSLSARSGAWSESAFAGVAPGAETFSIETRIDPVEAAGGDLQVVAGLMIGLNEGEQVQADSNPALRVDLREGGERAAFALWHRKTCLTMLERNPKPPGWSDNGDYQHPNELPFREGTGHRVKLVVWPEGEGSRVRLFVDDLDRPVEEHVLSERIRAGVVKLFTMRGGNEPEILRTSRFAEVKFSALEAEEAPKLPSMAESVLDAIDPHHPAMRPVAEAMKEGRIEAAKSLFLQHMRTRTEPKGPTLGEVADGVLHPNWQKISDEAVAGRYATIGSFYGFVDA